MKIGMKLLQMPGLYTQPGGPAGLGAQKTGKQAQETRILPDEEQVGPCPAPARGHRARASTRRPPRGCSPVREAGRHESQQ